MTSHRSVLRIVSLTFLPAFLTFGSLNWVAPASAQSESQDKERTESTVYINLWQFDVASSEGIADKFDSAEGLQRRVDQLTERGKLIRSSSHRVRTLTNLSATFQTGERIPVTVGATSSRGTISRQVSMTDVGALVQATTRVENDMVYTALSYSNSYLLKSKDEETQPSVANIELKLAVAAKAGEVVLLHKGAQGDNAIYLFAQFTTSAASPSNSSSALRARIEALRRASGSSFGDALRGGSRSGALLGGGGRSGRSGGVLGGGRSGATLGGGGPVDRNRSGSSRPTGRTGAPRSTGGARATGPANGARRETPTKRTNEPSQASGSAGSAKKEPQPGVDPRYLKYAAAFVKKYDRNGDGLVDKEEAESSQPLLRYFEHSDSNKDSKLSPEEFARGLHRNAR